MTALADDAIPWDDAPTFGELRALVVAERAAGRPCPRCGATPEKPGDDSCRACRVLAFVEKRGTVPSSETGREPDWLAGTPMDPLANLPSPSRCSPGSRSSRPAAAES